MSSSSSSLPDWTSLPPPGIKPSVVLFWAPWHEESSNGSLAQALSSLSGLYHNVAFGRIEAEACPDLSSKLGVQVIPTILLLNSNNDVVQNYTGDSDMAQITQAIQKMANSTDDDLNVPPRPSSATEEAAPSLLKDRLSTLIHSSQVMLFMKGIPTEPKCGFSRQAVELLQEQNIRFGSFDILQDPEVRQGLKEYSDWPTYPQLYVKGELIGGLDILKEMAAEGDLKSELGIVVEAQPSPKQELSLNDRLETLIKRHRVMLFMKGLPSAPQCGFSRQAVELLGSAKYDTFDILQDAEVRQGLKEYSDWPTYPQLYVEGDLVGGLDIMKEMEEAGELQDLLKG